MEPCYDLTIRNRKYLDSVSQYAQKLQTKASYRKKTIKKQKTNKNTYKAA